ncbi:hypothetical protein C8J57DRAFT_1237809 [Mycena rebaudengoi]|nr:hypothetical protein C8J57DRAFT_1237809 [Mycena rebaudengoi]
MLWSAGGSGATKRDLMVVVGTRVVPKVGGEQGRSNIWRCKSGREQASNYEIRTDESKVTFAQMEHEDGRQVRVGIKLDRKLGVRKLSGEHREKFTTASIKLTGPRAVVSLSVNHIHTMLLAGKPTALVTAFLMAVAVASLPLQDRKTLTDIHKDGFVSANENRVGAVSTVKSVVASEGPPEDAEGMGEKDATGIEYRPDTECLPGVGCSIHV